MPAHLCTHHRLGHRGAGQRPLNDRTLRCKTARRWQVKHIVAAPAATATTTARNKPINVDNDRTESKPSMATSRPHRLLRAPANQAMLILLLEHTALVHMQSLMRSALHRQCRRSRPRTKQNSGTIQSPVALDSRPRWSSPVSFSPSATLMTSLAADMTTLMISFLRSPADVVLTRT